MTTKIDLDEMESIARDATDEEWAWRTDGQDVLEGKRDGTIVLYPDPEDEAIIANTADRAHIAANSPPVTLALIVYIRELEDEVRITASRAGDVGNESRASRLSALLDRGAVMP
jgi:hypothetical protein